MRGACLTWWRQRLGVFSLRSGCSGANIARQPVRGYELPNIRFTLPGATPATVIIGAQFDSIDVGDGVAGNWSGSSLLHGPLDNQTAVQFEHYRDTSLLTTGFLTFLDAMQARAVQPPSGGN